MNENYTIFISSSDNYSDIWPLFFDFFQKYWPEYQGNIYLNTQKKEYKHKGLNIICTKVGKKKHFGETFIAGLQTVDNENILLIMIDYLFMGKVNNEVILYYCDLFKKYELDSLCLFPQNFTNYRPLNKNILLACPPFPTSVLFGYQIAFWRKDVLLEMALPYESPWMSEWYGSQRAERMRIKLGYINNKKCMPIPYDARGCLHQGRWLDNAVKFLHENNYKRIDFNKRGFYNDHKIYESLSYRIKIKWIIYVTGLKGSYMDLLKRKPIH
jgi:hypothetical protein